MLVEKFLILHAIRVLVGATLIKWPSNMAVSINSYCSTIVTKSFSNICLINIILVCAKTTWWLKLFTSNILPKACLTKKNLYLLARSTNVLWKHFICKRLCFTLLLRHWTRFLKMFKAEYNLWMSNICPL